MPLRCALSLVQHVVVPPPEGGIGRWYGLSRSMPRGHAAPKSIALGSFRGRDHGFCGGDDLSRCAEVSERLRQTREQQGARGIFEVLSPVIDIGMFVKDEAARALIEPSVRGR